METTWISEAGEVIIRLIEAGGDKAISALLWYLAYLLLRIAAIGGVIWVVFWQVGSVILGCIKLHSERKAERVTLLSEEISSRWEATFREACSDLSTAAGKLETHLDTLAKTSASSASKQPETSADKSD